MQNANNQICRKDLTDEQYEAINRLFSIILTLKSKDSHQRKVA